ncbi:uncharacterized protein LOC129723585 [Wyeomyia smithii]|uniref:uncharacterized protein LOC129723585 n=1 Tax=Wyeomyia smithii TaxID=174621 RepID=UPI002467D161|nr:uncharacterized protein LOC129723585 [Wyeomyia smithii]
MFQSLPSHPSNHTNSIMAHYGLGLFTLLAASCLVLVSSYDQSKSVIPLVKEPGSSRQERDLLLSNDDDDYEFFNRQSLSEPETAGAKSAFDQPGLHDDSAEIMGNIPPEKISALMAKLQAKSGHFSDVAREVAISAVNLLIAFGRLAEHSKDKFIILAK